MARGLRGYGDYQGSGNYRTHVEAAERAIGKPLPPRALVHHVDGNRANNENNNLVVCPNEAYHNLLHIRAEALQECGNANWRKCRFCKQYDDPDSMGKISKHRPNPGYYHRECHAVYETNRRRKANAR